MSTTFAGIAVTHISPQHCPPDVCGAFPGADFESDSTDIEWSCPAEFPFAAA